jgi:hypothetical protein
MKKIEMAESVEMAAIIIGGYQRNIENVEINQLGWRKAKRRKYVASGICRRKLIEENMK